MKSLLIAIALVFSFFAQAKEGTFYGKYKMSVSSYSGEVSLVFLLDSKDEMMPLEKTEWGETEKVWKGAVDTYVGRSGGIHSWGPSMETLTLGFGFGSDEDGASSYVTLAWLGQKGERELSVVSSYTAYSDGPNEIDWVEEDVTLYKWDKQSKEYKKIEKSLGL